MPLEPMLALPATDNPFRAAFAGRYGFEPKFDGYRAVLFLGESSCVVQSRRGHDITDCFPNIAHAAVEQIPADTGELVVRAGRERRLDYSALAHRIVSRHQAVTLAAAQPASFIAFDVLAAAENDLRNEPLSRRRTQPEALAADWSLPLQLTNTPPMPSSPNAGSGITRPPR
jgi:ATP-dependent DNA ligase